MHSQQKLSKYRSQFQYLSFTTSVRFNYQQHLNVQAILLNKMFVPEAVTGNDSSSFLQIRLIVIEMQQSGLSWLCAYLFFFFFSLFTKLKFFNSFFLYAHKISNFYFWLTSIEKRTFLTTILQLYEHKSIKHPLFVVYGNHYFLFLGLDIAI